MRRFICVLIQARTHFQQCNDAHGYSLNIHIVCHTTKKPYQCKLYNKSFTYICRVRVFENNHAIFCAVFLLTYEVWSSVWIGPRSKILVHTTVCIMVTVRIMMYTVQCTVYITVPVEQVMLTLNVDVIAEIIILRTDVDCSLFDITFLYSTVQYYTCVKNSKIITS